MTKRKRKLSAEERREKQQRRKNFKTIFVNGKQKRVRREPQIEGLDPDEFIRRNANLIDLHQAELWEFLTDEEDESA